MTRMIEKTVIVPSPIDQVWEAWTTAFGAESFFAPRANIALSIGGPYELLFNLDAPPGSQGSEGMQVLSFLPPEMLSFEWNAPPSFSGVRGRKTWVVVLFDELTGERTLVGLTHLGWQEGDEWDQVHAYFQRAWDVVLGRLVHRFANCPLDWEQPFTPEVGDQNHDSR